MLNRLKNSQQIEQEEFKRLEKAIIDSTEAYNVRKHEYQEVESQRYSYIGKPKAEKREDSAEQEFEEEEEIKEKKVVKKKLKKRRKGKKRAKTQNPKEEEKEAQFI